MSEINYLNEKITAKYAIAFVVLNFSTHFQIVIDRGKPEPIA